MAKKHTPGPWKATHIGEGEYRQEIVVDIANCGQIAAVLDTGNGQANAQVIAASPTTLAHLAAVLEWAKGNRGSKSGNPYSVPEISAALEHLAAITGAENKYDVDTKALAAE